MGGRRPEGHITDCSRNTRMEETSRRQRRMEGSSEGGQGTQRAVAPKMELHILRETERGRLRESGWVCVCVCVCVRSLSYPECNACTVLYCHLWSVLHYRIFPHYLINGTIFGEKNFEHKIIFLFSLQLFAWNTSHSMKNPAWYHKGTEVFLYSTRYSCQNVMKPKFARRIFEKYTNAKFHENSSSGSRVVPCGQRNAQTDMMMLILNFTILWTRLKIKLKRMHYFIFS
jgi:hypothetical protein